MHKHLNLIEGFNIIAIDSKLKGKIKGIITCPVWTALVWILLFLSYFSMDMNLTKSSASYIQNIYSKSHQEQCQLYYIAGTALGEIHIHTETG